IHPHTFRKADNKMLASVLAMFICGLVLVTITYVVAMAVMGSGRGKSKKPITIAAGTHDYRRRWWWCLKGPLRCWTWAMYERNALLQAFYLSLFIPSVLAFMYYGYPLIVSNIPSNFSAMHK